MPGQDSQATKHKVCAGIDVVAIAAFARPSRSIAQRALMTLALILAGDAAAIAQDAGSSSSGELGEIVVTAERRRERLQDVPISVSAVSGNTLENLGLKTFDDYAALIPNLAQATGTAEGVTQTRAIAIRGVSGPNTTAVYLNDTPIPISTDPRAIDIERVEVLRGPQGTLFGDAAMGGTVRFVTREPSTEKLSGMVEAEGSYTDHGGGGYDVDGRVNIPLIPEQLALLVTAYSAFDPGVFTRTWGDALDPRSPSLPTYDPGTAAYPAGQKDHVGAKQETGLAATLRYTPSWASGLAVTPMFIYQRSSGNGYPTADYAPENFFQKRPLDVAEGTNDTWSFGSLTAREEADFGHFIVSGSFFDRQAIDNEDGTEALSQVFLNLPVYLNAPIPTIVDFKYWTGEARFESTFKSPVQFVAGVFSTNQTQVYLENWVVPGLNQASGGAFGTDLAFWTHFPSAFREHAAFINVTYQVTTALQLSAGVRESHLEDDSDYMGNGVINGGYSNSPLRHTESHTAPRYAAKYEFSPNHMVYASAANGYRVGGANAPLPPICNPYLQQYGVPIPVPPYKSDTLWSFEVGTKNAWIDNRIQSRFAVYRINWNNIQQSVEFPCEFGYTANAGYATSKGSELEIDTRPLDHLLVSLAGGYEDAKITEASNITRTVVGQALQGVPRWTGSVISQYTVPFDTRSAFIRGDWTYTGFRRSYIVELPPNGLPEPSYSITNLRMGIDQNPWEVALFVHNLFDKLGTIGDLFAETSQIPGRPRFFVTRPRTFGIQVQRNF